MESVSFGHIIQFRRVTLSNDNHSCDRYHRGMPGAGETAFNEALCARVRALRMARGWTADQMATALGIPAERYRKYEYRTPLPHYLVERFALIVGRDVEQVLTGKTADRRSRSA